MKPTLEEQITELRKHGHAAVMAILLSLRLDLLVKWLARTLDKRGNKSNTPD